MKKLQEKTIPRLSDTNLLRYLSTITGVNVKDCEDFTDALYEIVAADSCVIPEGLNDALLVYERYSIRNLIWTLSEKAEFVQSMLHLMEEDEECLYVLVTDATLSGKDSLFLISVGIYPTAKEANEDNIIYMTNSWGVYGKPAHILSGGCTFKDGSVFSAVAVQLSSLQLKYDDEA